MLKNGINESRINDQKDHSGKMIEKVKVNDIEIRNGGIIPTYHLIKKLEAEYDHDFYFVCGSDLIPGLKYWENGTNIIREIKFFIF